MRNPGLFSIESADFFLRAEPGENISFNFPFVVKTDCSMANYESNNGGLLESLAPQNTGFRTPPSSTMPRWSSGDQRNEFRAQVKTRKYVRSAERGDKSMANQWAGAAILLWRNFFFSRFASSRELVFPTAIMTALLGLACEITALYRAGVNKRKVWRIFCFQSKKVKKMYGLDEFPGFTMWSARKANTDFDYSMTFVVVRFSIHYCLMGLCNIGNS